MVLATNIQGEERQTMTETPTATEFIPSDANGIRSDEGPGVRHLRLVPDGHGMEIVNEEPVDDDVRNHVFVCDDCGQSESLESDMAFHLRTEH
jgi:hypothetical protein